MKQILDEIKTKGFTRELLPHQKENLKTLINSSKTFADFSVPGTGKTSVALAYFYFFKKDGDQLLVVCPKTTISAWEKEVFKCTGIKNTIVELKGKLEKFISNIENKKEIKMITYEKLRQKGEGKTTVTIGNYIDKLRRNGKEMFIFLDESHKAKAGSRGQTGIAVGELQSCQPQIRYKLIMTGTPMPQDAHDLVQQFNFGFPYETSDPEQIAKLFKERFIRTTKKELGLKPKIITRLNVKMTPNHEELYRTISDISYNFYKDNEDILRLNDKYSPAFISAMQDLKRYFMILIQASTNPRCLINHRLLQEKLRSDADKKLLMDVYEEGPSTKMKAVCSHVRDLVSHGRKVVVWSSFVKTIEEMTLLLDDVGSIFIHGGVNNSMDPDKEDTRKGIIEKFHNDKDCNVLIANPASCAEGISLHEASHDAIYLDRTFTLTNYLQSVDRIHRIGIPKNIDTNIWIYLSHWGEIKKESEIGDSSEYSIDLRIDKSLLSKEEEMDKFMNSGKLEDMVGKEDLAIYEDLEDLSFQEDTKNIDEEFISEIQLKINKEIQDFSIDEIEKYLIDEHRVFD